MKKLFYFGSMLFFAALTYSCATDDKAILEPYTTIELDGYKYKTDLVATFQGQVGEEVTLGLGVYDKFDIYGVDFGDGKIVADTVCGEDIAAHKVDDIGLLHGRRSLYAALLGNFPKVIKF